MLFWLGLFMCINIGMLVRAIYLGMEVSLPSERRALLVATFPTMHSRDWLELYKAATLARHEPGVALLKIGDSTDAVHILASGSVNEIRADGTRLHRTASAMWGELSYCTEQQFDGSPCQIVTETTATEIVLPYPILKQLTARNVRLRAAMMEGFVRTAGLKHGLLLDSGASPHGDEKLSALESGYSRDMCKTAP